MSHSCNDFYHMEKIGSNFRLFEFVTCRNTRSHRYAWTHTHTHTHMLTLIDSALSQLMLISALPLHFSYRYSFPSFTARKKCYKIKAWIGFSFPPLLRPIQSSPRATDTSTPCRPSYQNQGIKLPAAKKTF